MLDVVPGFSRGILIASSSLCLPGSSSIRSMGAIPITSRSLIGRSRGRKDETQSTTGTVHAHRKSPLATHLVQRLSMAEISPLPELRANSTPPSKKMPVRAGPN
jgi:hypothetical protein